MRTRHLFLTSAAVAAAALLLQPPAEAAPKRTFEGTIALPANNAGSALGAGYVEVVEDVPAQVTCPDGGPLDGVAYKWFDLKADYKEIKLSGPKPAVVQEPPAIGTTNEYDLDMYGYDAKCKRIDGPDGANGHGSTGFETFRPTKAVRYVVVVYYRGPYPNIAIKVEANK